MKIKKLLAGIMSAVMVLGIMTFPTFAEKTTNEFNIGTNQTYTKLSDAITAASDKGYAEVTYNIYGKVVADEGVDATNNVWLNVIGASDTTVKKINFVGKSEDAELNISQRKVVLALNGGSASADVSYTDLKLSKGECTGTNVQDLGHAANYFTTWLRCGDSANRTVTYTNCTFPNGSSNNQYGKTVYNNCTFNKDNDEQYALWVYTAADNGVTLGGAVEINGGEMKAARGVKTYSENSADAVANVTLKNIKIETTVKPAVVSSIAGNISFNNVTANKGLIYAERVNSAKNLAEVKINGNSVNYAAQVGNKYYVSVDDAKKNVTDESTIKVIAYAKVGETEYATLAEAVEATKVDGKCKGEVVLLCDSYGGGIQIPSGSELTIDFNGYQYSVGDPTVGSPGTETNGFQLLKDSNIVFKNGKLYTNKAYILIQNYSNLTLEDMDLNLETVYTTRLYTLSNNNGDTILKGNTNISALEGNVAFDVCKYADYPGVSVTLDESMTGTINGIVEVDGKQVEGQKFDLKIKNGTINGKIKPTQAATNYNISISGGTFSEDVSEYCAEGCNAVLDKATGKYTIEKKVAKIGETEYKTLQEAINAAESNATVTLLCDTAESIVIGSGKEITLDLNGKTLTNVEKQHTITNNGKLNVTDSSASKSGAVDNVSHGKAALFNAEVSTAELNGGKFLRSEETGTDQDTSGGNSWYTIANKGAMTINAGVTVENKGYFSSDIVNGYYDTVGTGTPTLTINGGTFTGGVKTVKVDECGVLTITGGTFTNEKYPCIMNWNKTEISGGTFTSPSSNSVFNGLFNNTTAVGSLTIAGGAFEGGIINSEEYTGGNIAISDGTFSTDVSEYCVDGFKAVKGADGRYTIEEANWGKYTDSGCYVSNDTKYGMMRFMFAFTGDITGKTVASYGIKYISAENIGAELNENGAVSQSGNYTAFQGDVVGITYDIANTSNYYAAAYIDFGNGDIIWSAPQKCKINWNRTFTKYAPQTSENGGNE